MSEENQAQEAAVESTDRKRVNYSTDAAKGQLTVTYADEAVELGAEEEIFAKHPDVKNHLALVGLTTFLQRESGRVKDHQKLDAIEKAYERITQEGVKAFERKAGGGPRGPRKADKIAALAALKGATTAAIEKKLATMDKSEQDAILNHKKVLAKLEKMNSSADDLDLAV